MKQYELKQSVLDRMEIEGLIERIKILEHELALKEFELKNLTKQFIHLQEEYYKE